MIEYLFAILKCPKKENSRTATGSLIQQGLFRVICFFMCFFVSRISFTNACHFVLNRKSNLPLSKNRASNVAQVATLSRPSHIARPSSVGPRVVAPSSANRSSSANRPPRDTIGRSSSGLRRYGSDNYLNTPSRFSTMSTPLRGRSPAVRHSVMPPDSSRKSKHENILKVQEILQRDEAFYVDLNLKNGCLKSMTVNQFYMIMRRFVRLIWYKLLKSD